MSHLNNVTLFRWVFSTCLLLALQFPMNLQAAESLTDDEFKIAVDNLNQKSFQKKQQAIESFVELKDDRVLPVLKALLEAQLYYRKSDKRIVYAIKTDGQYNITDVVSGEKYGQVKKRKIKKIKVNNKLRKILRNAIARLSLGHPDADVRLAAVKNMISSLDVETGETLKELQKTEKDSDVLEMVAIALALLKLDSDDKSIRLKAIEELSSSVNPEARKRLSSMLEKDTAGEFIETDKEITKAAARALATIDDKLKLYSFIETTFFGLSLGSVLVLAAIGLAITFGVMGVINMAHGELMMIGAYTTYVIQLLMPNHIGLSLFVAIPAAFIVAGLFGIAIERGVIRFLYGRPLETLLATFGISLILQQLVRSVFSPLNRSVSTPEWMSGSLEINSALSLTYNRLYIIIFSLIVFFALLMILKKTVLGLQVRAVSQNRAMARSMGIRSEWVDALTFGLGSGIAGVAGVALSQLTNVGPNLGQSYIIDSFMVVVFGGVGNLWGTLVAGMSLGVANKVLEPWSGAVLAKILVLVFIILFIQKKPRGLFPQKGRAAED